MQPLCTSGSNELALCFSSNDVLYKLRRIESLAAEVVAIPKPLARENNGTQRSEDKNER